MHNLSKTQKLLLIITASAVVVIAVSIATIFAVSTRLVKPSQEIPQLTAQQVVESYQQAHSPDTVANDYTEQDNSTRNKTIDYSAKAVPYDLRLVAAQSVTYSRVDGTNGQNSALLTANAEKFMTNHGFTKTASNVTTTSTRVLYDSTLSVCQYTSFPAITDNEVAQIPATFGIGCIDKTAVASAYDDVDNLVALYRQTQAVPTITHISSAVVDDKKTPITVLYISTDETKMATFRAYFVSIDDQSTYLGAASIATENSEQPSVLSTDLTTSMDNPTYGDFLTRMLEKY